jgi:hypothetical protein
MKGTNDWGKRYRKAWGLSRESEANNNLKDQVEIVWPPDPSEILSCRNDRIEDWKIENNPPTIRK